MKTDPHQSTDNRKAHKPPTLQQKRGKKIKGGEEERTEACTHSAPGLSPRPGCSKNYCQVSTVKRGLRRGGLGGGLRNFKSKQGGLTWGQPCTTATFGWSGGGGGLDAGMMHKIAGVTVDLHAYISLLWSNKGVRFTASSAHIYATGGEVSCT